MEDELKTLQSALLGILQIVDAFCKREGIHYSLYAGTLLGAVRHQGFIPWDDDLDICMERAEYNRFLKAWKDSPPEGFILQNKENTPGFTQSFSKIRKEHTTFLQYEWEAAKYHSGIFIDVFPLDRMPLRKTDRLLFQWRCMQYLLLTREFLPPKGSIVQKIISLFVLFAVPLDKRAARRGVLLNQITADKDQHNPTVGIETLATIKTPLPSQLFDEYVFLPFEDGQYMCFARWDEYLTAKFGDYMTLPPEEERTWKHHPIILDFEHDYEELQRIGE